MFGLLLSFCLLVQNLLVPTRCLNAWKHHEDPIKRLLLHSQQKGTPQTHHYEQTPNSNTIQNHPKSTTKTITNHSKTSNPTEGKPFPSWDKHLWASLLGLSAGAQDLRRLLGNLRVDPLTCKGHLRATAIVWFFSSTPLNDDNDGGFYSDSFWFVQTSILCVFFRVFVWYGGFSMVLWWLLCSELQ